MKELLLALFCFGAIAVIAMEPTAIIRVISIGVVVLILAVIKIKS